MLSAFVYIQYSAATIFSSIICMFTSVSIAYIYTFTYTVFSIRLSIISFALGWASIHSLLPRLSVCPSTLHNYSTNTITELTLIFTRQLRTKVLPVNWRVLVPPNRAKEQLTSEEDFRVWHCLEDMVHSRYPTPPKGRWMLYCVRANGYNTTYLRGI